MALWWRGALNFRCEHREVVMEFVWLLTYKDQTLALDIKARPLVRYSGSGSPHNPTYVLASSVLLDAIGIQMLGRDLRDMARHSYGGTSPVSVRSRTNCLGRSSRTIPTGQKSISTAALCGIFTGNLLTTYLGT